MKTAPEQLTDLLTKYMTDVVPKHAGPSQKQETRYAFMAGAQSMFIVLNKVTELDEDAAVAEMDKMVEFFKAFVKAIT